VEPSNRKSAGLSLTVVGYCKLLCFCRRWSRSLQRRRRWFYVIRKLYFAGFQCMPVHSCPHLRHGCRPDWWWPKRSREVRALCMQDLGEIHYWSRPLDPSWFERDVELMPSPLAEQSAARLRTAPLSCVPHVPYIPHRTSLPTVHLPFPCRAPGWNPCRCSPLFGRAKPRLSAGSTPARRDGWVCGLGACCEITCYFLNMTFFH
jgi:hypothetical protein